MRDILRIIDANLNRAREGARVIEEHCRFLLDDPALSARLKAIRHGLAAVEHAIGRDALLAARDTDHDVGRHITGANEATRADANDVVAANLRRLQEALRVLEEYAKTLVGNAVADDATAIRDAVASLGHARYESYSLERELAPGVARSAQARRALLAQARLMLIVTAELCGDLGAEGVIRAAHGGGVRCFQLREKQESDRARIRQFEGLVRLIRELDEASGAQSLVLINDRADMALALGADGVHLGQDDLSVADVRRIGGAALLIGRSVRNESELTAALREGADYLGAGSMFTTQTKQRVILNGPEWGAKAAGLARPLPVFCIGGITLGNMRLLAEAFDANTRQAEGGPSRHESVTDGSAGGGVVRGRADGDSGDCHNLVMRVAVSSGICSASDPCISAREFFSSVE